MWHTWHLRFSGVHLLTHPDAAFGKVQLEFQHPWAIAFYAVGIICASWHFAYGLWLFAAKWGITTGDAARRRFGYVCFFVGLLFITVGALTMRSFLNTPLQPLGPENDKHDSFAGAAAPVNRVRPIGNPN